MEIKSIQKFNLINSIALISMSAWGYIDTNSFTALIPGAFGFILLILGTMPVSYTHLTLPTKAKV